MTNENTPEYDEYMDLEALVDERMDSEDFDNLSNADKLEEIKSAIESLISIADDIVEEEGGIIEARAKSYWLPIIANMLNSETELCSMQQTIDEINEKNE